MNPKPTTAITLSAPTPLHCQQRSPSGRRCRMAVSDPVSGLCFRHAALQRQRRSEANFVDALIGNVEEFHSAEDINHCLGGLLKLLARNEIAPRRAAVMAYTCNLLLRTLPAMEQQEKADDMFICDIPSAVRDRALLSLGVSPEDIRRINASGPAPASDSEASS